MDLLRPWLVALVLWVAVSVLSGVTVLYAATPAQLESALGALAWQGTLGFIGHLAVAAVATAVHRAPERRRRGRSALAALAVPVAGAVFNTAGMTIVPDAEWAVFAGWNAIALLGAVAGWASVRRLRRSRG